MSRQMHGMTQMRPRSGGAPSDAPTRSGDLEPAAVPRVRQVRVSNFHGVKGRVTQPDSCFPRWREDPGSCRTDREDGGRNENFHLVSLGKILSVGREEETRKAKRTWARRSMMVRMVVDGDSEVDGAGQSGRCKGDPGGRGLHLLIKEK